jgi:hypothetical protein
MNCEPYAAYTWIEASGRVLRAGKGGIVIVAEGTDTPLLVVDEVSDGMTYNLYLTPAAPIFPSHYAGSWEILLDAAASDTNETL